jgi:hypothetical protein
MINQALLRALKEYLNSDLVDVELNPRKRMAIEAIAETEKQEQGEPCPHPCGDIKCAVFCKRHSEHEQSKPVAWPCEIEMADFEQDTITLKMQCSDYKVSAGQYWLACGIKG